MCDVALVSGLILLLLTIYLYESGSVGGGLVVLPGVLVIAAYFAGVLVSYNQIVRSEKAKTKTFRIDLPLIHDLKSAGFPSDVIEALVQVIRVDETIPKNELSMLEETIVGEARFVSLVEQQLGEKLTNEMKKMLLKYSRVSEEQHITATPNEPASDNGAGYSGSNVKLANNDSALVQATVGSDDGSMIIIEPEFHTSP